MVSEESKLSYSEIMNRETAAKYLLWVGVAIFSVAMIRTTHANGIDFEVYWRAAQAFLSGQEIYSLEREGPMIFKYPPWILPFFIPFGWLPLELGKLIWGFVQAGCLIYATAWLLRRGISVGICLLGVVAFSGLWTVHAFVGQITLCWLALGLALGLREYERNDRGAGFQFLFWALSAKVLSLFPVLGFRWSLKKDLKPLLFVAVIWGVLSIPAYSVMNDKNPMLLIRSWQSAASSGGQVIHGQKVETKSREVQGLPSIATRILGIQEESASSFMWISLVILIVVAAGWSAVSKSLSRTEAWLGWMGLSAVVQPLAWFHFFVLAFPLSVCALDRAWKSKKWLCFGLTFVGTLMIGAVTQKTLGAFGACAEQWAVKSWGVLICAASLVISRSEFEKSNV